MSSSIKECIIIGAGPAGIGLAKKLSRENIDYTVLERGAIAETWRRQNSDIKLLSPWWTNVVDKAGLFMHLPFSSVDATQYYKYLKATAVNAGVNVESNCPVQVISQAADGVFELKTPNRIYRARKVVCATGYFASPRKPFPDFISDSSTPVHHLAEISCRLSQLRSIYPNIKRVLIIGKRVSAGQSALQLHDAGFEVALSTRSYPAFSKSSFIINARKHLYFVYEIIKVKMKPGIRRDSWPEMDGGRIRNLIECGKIALKPLVSAIVDGQVSFSDGKNERWDLILLATGYTPALDFLQDLVSLDNTSRLPALSGFESAERFGLYFLGLDNMIDFRSRYLRGIRSDVKSLSRVIISDLNPEKDERRLEVVQS